jgi:S-adenosylmethionine:tRNA ribosyltransferase-isomerase
LRAEIIGAGDEGQRLVRFDCAGGDFDALLEEIGQVPLPPYIKRADALGATGTSQQRAADRERYQTIYAERRGAIAAPTAGLHFTPRVLEALRARGVSLTEITLHVGYGTFAPVRVSDLNEHAVAAEHYEITPEAAATLNDARARGRRIVAVGTTTVRALESATDDSTGRLTPGARATALTITPGYNFKIVNALVTNFHLPRSSLLVLVASFAGRELTLAAYAHAVAARYRFYSYGDCMLIT